MGVLKEFREFAIKGNMIDMAVGIVIGAAFGAIVNSLVANIVMPPLNLATAQSGVNFTEMAWKSKFEMPKRNEDGTSVLKDDGSAVYETREVAILNYGKFIQSIVDFLIIAIAIFFVVKLINRAKATFEKEKAAEVAATPEDIQLLREIRDALVKR